MKPCGTPNCCVCVLPYDDAMKLPRPELCEGLLWHVARTGEGVRSFTPATMAMLEADGLRRIIERQVKPLLPAIDRS